MKNKKQVIALVSFVCCLVMLFGVYYFTKPDTHSGQKRVELLVVNQAGEEECYEVLTDGAYLIDVMNAAKEQGFTYEAENGDYGAMITAINGEEAIYTENQAYWSFYINGEYCEYGVSEQPVSDGDQFEIRYTKDEM